MLDLKNLETFVWVARLNGFRAAADRLNTTQPAISTRIAGLERDLGARLFDRRGRQIILTSKGIELLAYAERMLVLKAEIVQNVGNPASASGLLRLGVPETIVHTWLPVLIERIAAAYPELTLDIEVDSSPSLKAALLAETLDVAVLFAPVDEPRFTTRSICSFPLAWVASAKLSLPKRRQLSLADIAGWPVITFRRETPPYQEIRRLFARDGLAGARMFGSSSIAAMVRLALDGVGACVLPPVIVQTELGDGRLKQLNVEHVIPAIDFLICFRPSPANYLAEAISKLAAESARAYARAPANRSKILIPKIENED